MITAITGYSSGDYQEGGLVNPPWSFIILY